MSEENDKNLLPELKGKPGKKIEHPKIDSISKLEFVPEEEINTISQFFDTISKLQKQQYTFYRGDKECKNYKLIPNLYKEKYIKISKNEKTMIDEFTSLSVNKYSYNTNKFIEEMLMAQHYELPTRLQDWSESALTALYFAVYDDGYKDDSVLWALKPNELNKNIDFIDLENPLPNIISSSLDTAYSDKIQESYLSCKESKVNLYPIALNARKINPRIEAQRGVFVLFPKLNSSNVKCLTEYSNASLFLYKLKIKKEVAKTIYRALTDAGINQYSLFPEMRSIAVDIKNKYVKRVK